MKNAHCAKYMKIIHILIHWIWENLYNSETHVTRVDAPSPSGDNSRTKSSRRLRLARSNWFISLCFVSAITCSFQTEGSTTRDSPADMAAAAVSATVIPRLHRCLRCRRSCQTAEQVLPRGARGGIRDFLWYHTHGAARLEKASPSAIDRSMWHAHTFLAHSSVLHAAGVFAGIVPWGVSECLGEGAREQGTSVLTLVDYIHRGWRTAESLVYDRHLCSSASFCCC